MLPSWGNNCSFSQPLLSSELCFLASLRFGRFLWEQPQCPGAAPRHCPRTHPHQPGPATSGSSVPETPPSTRPYSTVHRVGGTDGHPLGVSQRSHGCSRFPVVRQPPPTPSIPTQRHPHPQPLPTPSCRVSQPGCGISARPRVIINLLCYFECLALFPALLPARAGGSAPAPAPQKAPGSLQRSPSPYPTARTTRPQGPGLHSAGENVGSTHKSTSRTISELRNELVL